MLRVLLVGAFIILLILDVLGLMWLVAFGGLGLAFAVVGHGGMWIPSIVIGAALDALFIWLTFVVGKRLGVF